MVAMDMFSVLADEIAVRTVEGTEWDEFVKTVPWASPQHRFAWGNALATSFGYVGLRYRVFYRGGHAVAGIPLMRFSVGGPIRALHSSAFDSYGGPLVDPQCIDDPAVVAALLRDIDAEAKTSRAFEARLTLPPVTPPGIVRALEAAERSQTVARNCPVLDLDRPLDRIAAGYDPAVRRAIRRSAKEGVEVYPLPDHALVKEAYPVYHATMERIGGTAKPWHFLEKLMRDGLAVPFTASRGGRPVGLVILLVSGGMAIYWISAADISESTARPTNALVDAAVRWCHGNGIKRFSFGESPGERATLEKFKMGWGPDILSTVTWVRVYRPLVQKGWQALEPAARQAYALWDRLKRTDRRASSPSDPGPGGIPAD